MEAETESRSMCKIVGSFHIFFIMSNTSLKQSKCGLVSMIICSLNSFLYMDQLIMLFR